MFTIEFILPYANLALAVEQAFNAHPERHNMDSRISFITHDKIKSSEIRGDIVIARGLTAAFLNKILKGSVIVLEIPMTGYDILKAIKRVNKRFGQCKIALIATENVIYGFEEQINDVASDIKTYKISFDSNIKKVIQQAFAEGAQAVIGGNEVISLVEEEGLNGVRIETNLQSIRQVIDEAWNIHATRLEEQTRAQRLLALIENIEEGIIVCDKDSKVTICNSFVQSLIGRTADSIVGKKLSEIDKNFDSPPFNELRTKENVFFMSLCGTKVVVTRIPLIVHDTFTSGTIIIQKVSLIEEIENRNRIASLNNGLIARHSFQSILGTSHAIEKTKELALSFSKVEANVLIMGETGTGKELFAQSIHNASSRKKNAFVAINCAALPESLLESELFGYVEGAFTGALRQGKAGMFELAHKGTIFLDEISEMSYALQGRLLRVLEERSIMRLGANKVIPIDVRIIAASNQDLEKLVSERKFRQDLFYRLDVLRLEVPPLRNRSTDIPCLMESFLARADKKNNVLNHAIDQSIYQYLKNAKWPGNIRQLKNLCERLSAIVEDSLITISALEKCFPINSIKEETQNQQDTNDEIKNITRALSICNGNKSKAAILLGIDRSTLYRKIQQIQS